MEPDQRKIFQLIGVVVVFLLSFTLTQYYNTVNNAADQKTRMAQIGKLQFRGRVISTKTYKFHEKDAYMICVKLDTTSVNDFYIYNDLSCVKIKNGIATMAVGYYFKRLGTVDSVEVNMNNSGKIRYIYGASRAHDLIPFDLAPLGASKSDLNACN